MSLKYWNENCITEFDVLYHDIFKYKLKKNVLYPRLKGYVINLSHIFSYFNHEVWKNVDLIVIEKNHLFEYRI